jgi:hypothetical protein
MSGIEAAGLVLGVLPIIFEGLEAYKKGIGSIRTGLHRRKEVEVLCRKLKGQESLLQEFLRTILLQSGCDFDDRSLALTVNALHDPEVQADVQKYLGFHFETFIDNLHDCDEVLQQLVFKITKFVPADKVSWFTRSQLLQGSPILVSPRALQDQECE